MSTPLPSYELIFKIIDTFFIIFTVDDHDDDLPPIKRTIPANLDKIRQRGVYVVNVLIKICKFHVAL